VFGTTQLRYHANVGMVRAALYCILLMLMIPVVVGDLIMVALLLS
jgi:hypothetical protein